LPATCKKKRRENDKIKPKNCYSKEKTKGEDTPDKKGPQKKHRKCSSKNKTKTRKKRIRNAGGGKSFDITGNYLGGEEDVKKERKKGKLARTYTPVTRGGKLLLQATGGEEQGVSTWQNEE